MEMDRFKLPKRLFDDFRMIFYGLSILKAVLKWWSMTRFVKKKKLKIVWFLLSRSLEYQQPRSVQILQSPAEISGRIRKGIPSSNPYIGEFHAVPSCSLLKCQGVYHITPPQISQCWSDISHYIPILCLLLSHYIPLYHPSVPKQPHPKTIKLKQKPWKSAENRPLGRCQKSLSRAQRPAADCQTCVASQVPNIPPRSTETLKAAKTWSGLRAEIFLQVVSWDKNYNIYT